MESIFKSPITAVLFILCLVSVAGPAMTQSLNDIVVEPPTLHSLGFSVPYSGASVGVKYRVQGSGGYKTAQDLLEVSSGQFAGSVMGLEPGTTYDVQFNFGATTLNLSTRTRSEPRDDPLSKTVVNVSDDSALAAALSNARPGHVISLSNGVYTGKIEIQASGTEDNPIILRGESTGGVIIRTQGWPMPATGNDCNNSGTNLTIRGSHVYVENMTLEGEYWGVTVNSTTSDDTEGVVIRNTRITNVHCGILSWHDNNTGFYICNNVLEGQFTNENTGRPTWDVDGIRFTGMGHTLCHNTFSGFGDTIDIPTHNETRSVDIFRNDIRWGGDDGLELDGAEGNIRAYENRVSNSGTGISLQPGGGGPFYIFRNVLYNLGEEWENDGQLWQASLPFKFKDGAKGLLVYHNTTIRAGSAWSQGESVNNSRMFNNLLLGSTGGARFGISSDSVVDYNGFNFDSNYVTSANSVQLSLPIFSPADEILATGTENWEAFWFPRTFELAPGSDAVDAGVVLPNINDGYSGAAPDLGAVELGSASPIYGALSLGGDVIAPATPTGLIVQ